MQLGMGQEEGGEDMGMGGMPGEDMGGGMPGQQQY
jgi:hypothetical protein